MLSNVKFVRRFTAFILASMLVFGFVSCAQDDDDNGKKTPADKSSITYLEAKNGVPEEFQGTWVNDVYGWHSEYAVSANQINDKSMSVLYNVVSEETVITTEGSWTLVFCQVAEGSGTQYTPAGNYYAIALKLSGGMLNISCPLDYSANYKSLSELKAVYTASHDIEMGSANFYTVCDKQEAAVSVSDEYGTTVKFTKDKISYLMMSVAGLDEAESIVPVRDTSKETGNILFYAYGDRSLAGDLEYVAIKNEEGSYYVYWYTYDEDEDENAYEVMYPDFMPTVTEEQLAAIKALFE